MRTCVLLVVHPAIRSVWSTLLCVFQIHIFYTEPSHELRGHHTEHLGVFEGSLEVCLLPPRDQPATARGRRVYLTFTYHACSQPLRRRAACSITRSPPWPRAAFPARCRRHVAAAAPQAAVSTAAP